MAGGLVGFVVGYGEGNNTEGLMDELSLAVAAGATEATLTALAAVFAWFLGLVLSGFGAGFSLPAMLAAEWGSSLGIATLMTFLSLLVTGAVGGLIGVYARQLFHAWFGTGR